MKPLRIVAVVALLAAVGIVLGMHRFGELLADCECWQQEREWVDEDEAVAIAEELLRMQA